LLTRDQIEASITGNPFVEKNRLILRLDMATRSDELKVKLKAAPDWDLIICDEAHRMAASYFGGEVKETRRYKLDRLLGTRARNFLLCPSSDALGRFDRYWNGGSGSIAGWSLGGFRVVFQSSLFDGVAFDSFSFQEDGLASAEVDVGRRDVSWAFVIASVIVVLGEARDLGFEITGQVVVLEQNAVLERLVPALDLALGLGMARNTANLRNKRRLVSPAGLEPATRSL
jgi:hypothetical protein